MPTRRVRSTKRRDRALAMPEFYITTYCNHAHRTSDGKPIDHECYILPASALAAERDDRISDAAEIIHAAKPLRTHRGVRSEATPSRSASRRSRR